MVDTFQSDECSSTIEVLPYSEDSSSIPTGSVPAESLVDVLLCVILE